MVCQEKNVPHHYTALKQGVTSLDKSLTRRSSSYPHSKRLHSSRHLFPDSPETKYAKGFAIQLCTHELRNQQDIH